ncbi:MAG: hypothetical protein ACTSQ8_00040 [Candidatus Helarchaeota archaeon]
MDPMDSLPLAEHYLFVRNVTQTEFIFSAKKECYILIDINNTGLTSFWLDNKEYFVSYGFNVIPINFDEYFSNHKLVIEQSELQFFKSITVEPVFIDQGFLNTTMNNYTTIEFQAAGLISNSLNP